MIDTKKGVITLCDSEFCISQHAKPQDLTEGIPRLISQTQTTNTGYTHFGCWLDIEPQVYVSASICFHCDVLEFIQLFPQHQSTTVPAPQPSPLDTKVSNPLVHAWHIRFFTQDEMDFGWGRIRYCKGNDPIYHPTSILIEYRQKQGEN